jgi:hypothetical protein
METAIIFGLIVLFLLSSVVSEVMQFVRNKRRHEHASVLTNARAFDTGFFLVLLLMCVMIVIVMRQQQLLHIQADNDTKFIDMFSDVAQIARHTQFVCGLSVFLQTFRFVKVMRLFPRIGPSVHAVAKTLVDSIVLQFLVFLCVLLLGCGMAMTIIFGSHVPNFNTFFPSAFFSLYRFSYGDWDIEEMNGKDGLWGHVIFFGLAFLLTGTLTNVFIAVVSEQYSENLRTSDLDWTEEVNSLMASWFGHAFEEAWGASQASAKLLGELKPALEAKVGNEASEDHHRKEDDLQSMILARLAKLEDAQRTTAKYDEERQDLLQRTDKLLQQSAKQQEKDRQAGRANQQSAEESTQRKLLERMERLEEIQTSTLQALHRVLDPAIATQSIHV